MKTTTSLWRSAWAWLAITLLLIVVVALFAPLERTLGERVRLVYVHGAWVWAGKIAYGAAAIAGLAGLIARRIPWQRASLALGRTGLFFWLTYLPMSLWMQQLNWGGIFWDEPRWRVPLAFGIAGVLLQAGLWVMADLRISSAANAAFGAALWYFLGNIENVLHPDSPIFTSDAVRIQIFFVALLALSLFFGMQLAYIFNAKSTS